MSPNLTGHKGGTDAERVTEFLLRKGSSISLSNVAQAQSTPGSDANAWSHKGEATVLGNVTSRKKRDVRLYIGVYRLQGESRSPRG